MPSHILPLNLADAKEEEDPAQLQPTHGVPRGLGDGLQRASLPNCVRQVTDTTLTSLLQRRVEAGERVFPVGRKSVDKQLSHFFSLCVP